MELNCAEHSASGTLRYTLHLHITSNNDESCACVYVCVWSVGGGVWDEGRNDGQYVQSKGSGWSVCTSSTLGNMLFEL